MTPEIEKTPEIETTPGTVLWRFRRGPQGIVVKRPHRREVWGTAYIAQRCRLIPDRPDAGDESYPCKIADVSTGGFCVVCNAAETSPRLFRAGAEMTLEAWDGERLRVEIRWNKNGRLGLKCFRSKVR